MHFAVSPACAEDRHKTCFGKALCSEPDCGLTHPCVCTCHAPALVRSGGRAPDPKPLEACLV